MQLFLVQHGVARPEEDDPERPLTEAGAEEVERVARWAAAAGVEVEEIRHSGKRRAEQTAQILARHLLAGEGEVRSTTGLEPNDDVRLAAQSLASARRRSLMLVGHLPFLSRLASLLITGQPQKPALRFTNGGVVCLLWEGGEWTVSWALTPELVQG